MWAGRMEPLSCYYALVIYDLEALLCVKKSQDNIWKLRSLCSGAAFLRQPQIGSDYTF